MVHPCLNSGKINLGLEKFTFLKCHFIDNRLLEEVP